MSENIQQLNPLNITTSVLGGVDYRWGTDTALCSADDEVTVFGCNAASVNYIPLITNPPTVLGSYTLGGLIIGAQYDITCGANEISLNYNGIIIPSPGVKTPIIYIAAQNFVTFYYVTHPPSSWLVTAQVYASESTFNLPLVFPNNAASITN